MRNPELPSCHASHLVGGLVNAHTKFEPRDILEKMQPTLNSIIRNYANSYPISFAWALLVAAGRGSVISSLALDTVLDDPRMLLHLVQWDSLLRV